MQLLKTLLGVASIYCDRRHGDNICPGLYKYIDLDLTAVVKCLANIVKSMYV